MGNRTSPLFWSIQAGFLASASAARTRERFARSAAAHQGAGRVLLHLQTSAAKMGLATTTESHRPDARPDCCHNGFIRFPFSGS
jgi:hypothetical protein